MEFGFLKKIIENRKITFFFVIVLSIFGLYNYWLMPKQENPQITPPVAKVTVIYPGASPEEIEKDITEILEDEIATLEGVDFIESYSQNSVSAVIVWLDMGTNVEESWDKLRQKMEDIQEDLPDGAQNIQVDTEMAKTAGFILSFSGKNYSFEQLNYYASKAKKNLEDIKGISRIEINGEQKKQLKIEINTDKLNRINVSLEEITNILKSQNVKIPAGDIYDGNIRLPVNTSGNLKDIKEIENLIIGISEENGNLLYMKDISHIYFEKEDGATRYLYNGEKSVFLTGYFQENKNVLIIGKELSKTIEDITEIFPDDLEIDYVLNQPGEINKSVNNLMLNLLQGILFVVFVVFLGMGFRNSIAVAMAIPFSIILSFSVMKFIGLQIHQISIAGFIISLGLLVDNAIVISDSIQVRVDNEEDQLDSCIKGVKDVAIPVLTATITTIAAYTPLLILEGVAGEYVRSVPQIVIITLTASYFTAIFFTPLIAFLFFKKKEKINHGDNILKWFIKASNWGLERKKVVVYFSIIALISSLLLATFLPLIFFPKADKNVVYIDIKAEQVANIEKTEELTKLVEELLKKEKEIVYTGAAIGEGLPKFFITLPGFIKAPDSAQLMAEVDLSKGKRFKSNTEFLEYFQEIIDTNISGGSVVIKELEQAEPSEAPVIVKLTGEDKDLLKQNSSIIQYMLHEIPGTYKVRDDSEDKRYQYKVETDTSIASQSGLTRYNVQNEISIALNGRKVSEFKNEDGSKFDIFVKSDIENLEELKNFYIKSPITNKKVLLKSLATIKGEAQIPMIKRYNRENNINVLSDVKLGYSAVDIQNALQKKIIESNLYNQVNIEFSGEKDNIFKYFGGLGIAALFAFAGIYIIMMIQFKSLLQPLIIMTSIPFSVVGAILGLFVFRQPISFTALLGLVSLLGIVINNAIILLDYINAARNQGMGIEEACRNAVEKRVRPIILTTTTTILGLIPLIFSGTLFVPMAVALMSGLLVSTLLTLVILPVVYLLVFDIGGKEQWKETT